MRASSINKAMYVSEFESYYIRAKDHYKFLMKRLQYKYTTEDDVIDELVESLTINFSRYNIGYHDKHRHITLNKKLFRKPYNKNEIKTILRKCLPTAIEITGIGISKEASYDITLDYHIIDEELYIISDKQQYEKYKKLHTDISNYYIHIEFKFYNDLAMWEIRCEEASTQLPFDISKYLMPL